jgi:hypothetical protein
MHWTSGAIPLAIVVLWKSYGMWRNVAPTAQIANDDPAMIEAIARALRAASACDSSAAG